MGDVRYKPLGLAEIASPSLVPTPEAGIASLFVRPGGALYLKLSDGSEFQFGNTGSLNLKADKSLAGLSVVNSIVTAADEVLGAIGKIQGQINAITAVTSLTTTKLTTIEYSNTSDITYVNVAQLDITVEAGKFYSIEYLMRVSSDAVNRGMSITLTSASAVGTLACAVQIQSGSDGTGAFTQGSITSFGDPVDSPSVPTANEPYLAMIRGTFVCTTSGSIFPQFKSETNGSVTKVLANSLVISRRSS